MKYRVRGCLAYTLQPQPPYLFTKVNMEIQTGINIEGLNDLDKKRISEVGLWRWLEEITTAKAHPKRRSLDYKQQQMAKRKQRQK